MTEHAPCEAGFVRGNPGSINLMMMSHIHEDDLLFKDDHLKCDAV
jgi:hypothetical protein